MKQPGCIDREGVWQILKALRNGSQPPHQNPLLYLQLVDNILAETTYPASPEERLYALFEVLTVAISRGIQDQRQVFDLEPPQPQATLAAVQKAIDRDGYSHNPEMIGWSWLYYGFVRVDLHISRTQFCQWVHIEARTLRRYQQRALIRLTGRLITAERQARQKL